VKKPCRTNGGRRPRQTGTLMLRLYGDELAHLQTIVDYLDKHSLYSARTTRAEAVRWSLAYLVGRISKGLLED
jgi:hypothetical protein